MNDHEHRAYRMLTVLVDRNDGDEPEEYGFGVLHLTDLLPTLILLHEQLKTLSHEYRVDTVDSSMAQNMIESDMLGDYVMSRTLIRKIWHDAVSEGYLAND